MPSALRASSLMRTIVEDFGLINGPKPRTMEIFVCKYRQNGFLKLFWRGNLYRDGRDCHIFCWCQIVCGPL
jgi:hypothetical protein